MKKLFFAALIAATAATSFNIPAQAASSSVTITTSNSEVRRDHRRNDRREIYRKKNHREMRRHNRNRDCFVKKIRERSHGRTIVRTIRVCK